MTKYTTFTAEPYGATVYVIVSDNPVRAYKSKRWHKMFGINGMDKFHALTVRAGPTFGLFLPSGANAGTIAHEVFHLTHRILEYCDVKFDKDNHEPAAYLHGHLIDKVLEMFR